MDKNVLTQVQRMFEQKRQTAEAKANLAFDFACQNETFANLDRQEREIVFEMGKLLFANENVDDLQNQLDKIKIQKDEVLSQLKMTSNDLLPQYDCKLCNDTGAVDGKRCKCFQQEVNKLLTQNSNLLDVSLSLDSFVAKNDVQQQVADVFKRYLAKANQIAKRNLFVSGKTGTGKTHLVSCLANDMLRQNYSVLFTSAFNLNNNFLQIHLAKVEDKANMLNNLLSTDVLVIDDLGSENKYNNVTEEYLCNLLNERTTANKFTFITTNLDFAKLQQTYGDRIHSRLSANNVLRINLTGTDQRLAK